MQRYKVTLILTAEDFMDLVPHLGSISASKIEKVVERTDDVKLDPSALRKGWTSGKRKSKVVDTILNVLQDGHAAASDLRSALAARGMSESSLSTGLSILQKSGQIQRDGHGTYFLSAHEGAAA